MTLRQSTLRAIAVGLGGAPADRSAFAAERPNSLFMAGWFAR